ncbi:hypothetical protein H3005_00355 [Stenotrophomonas sp. Br8]|uniref:hypothetical protein n=1 Tax=Stenotrophomonas sp. Br8 TaxID=2759658 RepID=UPI00168A52CE|nr:hypothetical protein [Stenotrophomonas sp. Br8]MBD3680308.1 hypothetical protein [Stenotrophomonas sp. Br8]
MTRVSRRKKWSFFGLIFTTFAVAAATVTINAAAYPYNQVPAAQSLSAFEMAELRIAGLTGLAGMYRITHGLGSLPIGSKIKVTWGDGSVEEGAVVCLAGSVCVKPVPGTQKAASGGGGGGGYSGPISSGSYGGGGGGRTGSVSVGGPSPIKPGRPTHEN